MGKMPGPWILKTFCKRVSPYPTYNFCSIIHNIFHFDFRQQEFNAFVIPVTVIQNWIVLVNLRWTNDQIIWIKDNRWFCHTCHTLHITRFYCAFDSCFDVKLFEFTFQVFFNQVLTPSNCESSDIQIAQNLDKSNCSFELDCSWCRTKFWRMVYGSGLDSKV